MKFFFYRKIFFPILAGLTGSHRSFEQTDSELGIQVPVSAADHRPLDQ